MAHYLKTGVCKKLPAIDLGWVRKFFTAMGASTLTKTLRIVSAPITIYVLAPEEYGLLSLAYGFIAVVSMITDMGLNQVMVMEYFNCKTGWERQQLVKDIVWTYLLLSGAVILTLGLSAKWINSLFFGEFACTTIILASAIAAILAPPNNFFFQLLALQNNIRFYSCLKVAFATVVIVANVVFIFWLSMGALGAVLSVGLANLMVVGCWVFIRLKRGQVQELSGGEHQRRGIRTNMRRYRRLAWSGLNLVPRGISSWALSWLDRLMLANRGMMTNVGNYALADALRKAYIEFFNTGIDVTYLPHTLSKMAGDRRRVAEEFRSGCLFAVTYVVGMTILCVVGYFALKPLASLVIPEKYVDAIPYALPIVLCEIVGTAGSFMGPIIALKKKVKYLVVPAICASGMNIVINRFAIPIMGVYGCMLSTFISNVFMFGCTFFIARHLVHQEVRALKLEEKLKPQLSQSAESSFEPSRINAGTSNSSSSRRAPRSESRETSS